MIGENIVLKLAIGILLIYCELSTCAQNVIFQSNDSVAGVAELEYSFGGYIQLNVNYDFAGLPNTTALNIPEIPVGEYTKRPYTNFDSYQSRLKLEGNHQTRIGNIRTYIEMDFWGAGARGNLRLRHVFIETKRWLFGHTFSTFCDPDAWPNMTDWDGPPTGTWSRQSMIRYTHSIGHNSFLSFSAEAPFIDYEINYNIDSNIAIANQNVPDLHFRYRFESDKGHLHIAAVYRTIRYEVIDNQEYDYLPGWGVNLSAGRNFKHGDKLFIQYLTGEGIMRYLVGFGGNNWDAVVSSSGNIDLLPVSGGFLGFDHYWGNSKKYSSTVVVGTSTISNNLFSSYGDWLIGYWGLVNLYWYPTDNLRFALEYTTGYRKNALGQSGNASRVQFIAYYQL